MQDHTTVDGIVVALNKTVTDKNYQWKVNDAYKYKEIRDGPLAAPGAIQCGVFLQTKYRRFIFINEKQNIN